jgi:hypothetical protein
MPWVPPAPIDRPRTITPYVFGGLLGLGGVWYLVGGELTTYLAVALIATGIAMVVARIVGRVGALVPLGLFLALALLVTSALGLPWHGGVGDRTWQPASAVGLRGQYQLGVGDLTLDLRDVSFTGHRHVDANVGVGRVLVIVPPYTQVVAHGHAGIGNVRVFGQEDDGLGASRTATVGSGTAVLDLDLHAGVGAVEVRR